ADTMVREILEIGKQGRMVEVAPSPHFQRSKHLIYQRSHRKRDAILARSLQNETEVLVVKADTPPRSKIMGQHTRSTQFDHPIGGQTTSEHLQDFSLVNSRLRPKHQRLAHRFNGQGNHNLIAGLDHLTCTALPNMHNCLAQRLKDGQAAFENVLVATHHNGEQRSDSSLIAATHGRIQHGYMIFSQSLCKGSRRDRRDGTHIDDYQPIVGALDHSTGSKQYLLNLSSTREHGDYYIRGR